MQYTQQQMLDVVNKQLLLWIKKDETVKNAVFELIQTKYPTKKETDDKFEKMLLRMDEDRVKQDKKWEEQKAADNKKWEEQKAADNKKWEEHKKEWEDYLKKSAEDREAENKKWEKNQNTINAMIEEMKADNKEIKQSMNKLELSVSRYEQSMGAIGTRWGLHSEASFRNALTGILRELNPQYEVIHYDEFDKEGIVFASPSSVEIDVIIKNGKIYLIEIKSSVSKSEASTFLRKVKYYEKRHKKKVFQVIMISPMIDEKAKDFAAENKIMLYSYANDVVL